jgi:chromosome segregation ATPase
VAESPALTIARLLGGVVLLNGNLGHQVLGQLLITNSNEVAIAGAAAAVAATSGQRNAAAQIAIRTAVPALAVRGLLLKQEQRIDRREALLAERERQLDELTQAKKKSDQTIKTQKQQIEQGITLLAKLEAEKKAATSTVTALEAEKEAVTSTIAVLEAEKGAANSTITALGNRNQELVTEIGAFRADVVRQSGLKIDKPYRPPKSTTRRKKTTTPRKTSTPPRTRKPRKRKA